jgi:hypothetical protein
MKFSWLLSSLLLCPNEVTAFVPRTTFQPQARTSLWVATNPATSTNADLGLEHPPISPFGKGQSTTKADRQLLGGKGANLAEMTSIGLAVPPGFTLSTECCARYCSDWNKELPDVLWEQVKANLKTVEKEMNAEFGSPSNPLLLSVRSGAAISMPGKKFNGGNKYIGHSF